MRPEFITAMYFEGRILLFEKFGDVYEFEPRHPFTWRLLCSSPWPDPRDAIKATLATAEPGGGE